MTTLLLLLLPALAWAQGPDQVSMPPIVFDSDQVTTCAGRKLVSGAVSYCDSLQAIQPLGTVAAGRCGDGVIDLDLGEECDTPIGVPGQILPGTTNCRQASDCNMTPGIAGRPPCTCPATPPQECGDGQVTGTEVCEPPGGLGTSGCTALQRCATDCLSCAAQTPPVCGDGAIDAPEVCDARMCSVVTGCLTSVCKADCSGCGTCGDGVLDTGEACDPGDSLCAASDGNPAPNDTACRTRCTTDCVCPPAVCGNGILEAGEQCDGTEGGCLGVCTACQCSAPPPQGLVRQLSPTGNDNNVSGFLATHCTGNGVPNPCCSGVGTGSCDGPWLTFDRAVKRGAVNSIQPGETLELLDGTYTKATNGALLLACSDGTVPTGPSWYTGDVSSGTVNGTCTAAGRTQCGTAGSPITIRARRPRKAVIQSDGSHNGIYVVGCRYWTLQDLVVTSQDNPAHSEVGGCAIGSTNCQPTGGSTGVMHTVVAARNNDLGNTSVMTGACKYSLTNPAHSCGDTVYVHGSQDITLQGLLISGNNRYQNASALVSYQSADVLYDRVEAYKSTRNLCSFLTSIRGTIRGSYCTQSSRPPLWGPIDSQNNNLVPGGANGQPGLQYASAGGIVESSIVQSTTYNGDGMGWIGGSTDQFLGVVSLGGVATNARQSFTAALGWPNSGARNQVVENMLVSGITTALDTYPFYLRTNTGLKVRNLMVWDIAALEATPQNLRIGLAADSYDAEGTDPISTGCAELRASAGATPANACSLNITNSVVANPASLANSTGISVADQAAPVGTSCVLDRIAVKNFATALAGQAASGCTVSDSSSSYSLTGVGLTSTDCVVVPTATNRDLGSGATEKRGFCVGGSGINASCDEDADCTGSTCEYPIGPNLACRYVAGARQTGSAYDMWVAGTKVPANCAPATDVTVTDTVSYPACNARFYGCGPIVTGYNDADDTHACADVHERLNLDSDGNACARPVCGAAAGVTTTTTTTTTVAATTTTTLAHIAAQDWTSAMNQFYKLEEGTAATRLNDLATTCAATGDLGNGASGTQDLVNYREGSAAVGLTNQYIGTSGYAPTCTKLTGNISAGAWIKPVSISGDDGVLGAFNNDAGVYAGYRLLVSAGVLQMAVGDGTGVDYCGLGGATVEAGAWSHVAGTFNNTANTIDTFTDGVSNGGTGTTCDRASIAWTNLNRSWRIGESNYSGVIDEAYVSAVALTATQHARIASCGVRGERCRCTGASPTTYHTCTTAADCGGAPAVCTNSQCRGYLGTGVTLPDCNADPPT